MRVAVLLLAGVVISSCRDRHSPEGVADGFVDAYVLHANQEEARPLTAGLARRQLDAELASVRAIRGATWSGSSCTEIYYERGRPELQGDLRVFPYAIRIRCGGTHEDRSMEVAVGGGGGAWRVQRYRFLR